MAFLVKALFSGNECSKNADISILSNFWAFFPIFFSISINFAKCCLLAKFQTNWTIQTEIIGGAAIPICIKPGLFRVKKGTNHSACL